MPEMTAEELDMLNARVAAKMGWSAVVTYIESYPLTTLYDPDDKEVVAYWGIHEPWDMNGVPDYTDASLMVELMLKYKISVLWINGDWTAQCSAAPLAATSNSIGLAVCKVVDMIG